MKVAILSDTHNQAERLGRLLSICRSEGVDCILHCGDIEDAPIVSQFSGWNAHFVFGNCDWDKNGLTAAITKAKCHLHENFGHLDLDGITVAFLHGHESSLLRDLIQSQAYDFLFHGHTHLRADSLQGKTRVVNPGALHRATEKSFVIMDTSKGDLQTIILD